MSNKSVRITPLGVLEALPKKYKIKEKKVVKDKQGNKEVIPAIFSTKLLTMYKPKDTKEYPMEHILHTYVYTGKQYPYNSKKRGWNNEPIKENN